MDWALTIVALALIAVAAVSSGCRDRRSRPRSCSSPSGSWWAPRSSMESISRAPARPCARWPRRRWRSCSSPTPRASTSEAAPRDLGTAASARNRAAADDRPRSARGGAIFDVLTVWEAVILGVVLAPTDAALGQAVVTRRACPGSDSPGLNIERVNDGICVPLLFAAVAAADVESHISHGRSASELLLEEIGYGIVGAGRQAGDRSRRRRMPAAGIWSRAAGAR